MDYKVYKKEPGVISSLKGLVNRKMEIVSALNNITLEIDKGEVVGFIGPNGAGKTTFLKILSGLLYPTSGIVKVNDFVPFERKKAFRKSISLVMGQKSQLIWDIAPIETFRVNRAIYEIDEVLFKKSLNELSDLLDVTHCLNVPVRQLSLGERMKMEVIASLLHFPKILFLDEPTIGLDLKSQIAMRDFIKSYAHKNNINIIITSHYMEDIKSLCKQLVIINKGSIIYNGMLEKLYKSKSEYKYISLKTNEEIIKKLNIEAINAVDDEYKIKVKEEELNWVINKLINNGNIRDLTIENKPIEEIILDILNEGGNSFDKISDVF
ncbi:ABC transporter ATP-binding protein [Clostridium tertium]|uniref:ABC transporter ATP-binding protein n=1 Tax=Clostridium tertium TaxID=1559 RepID=UPI0024B35331|nr:ATP-binding cassette domain-containing protein [Clostridium tertium]MDI9216417.1 ATP-binding cassette domain-containing protein [Clostridium tertium]